MEDRTLYWLWLSHLLGAGCKNSSEIIDASRCNPLNVYDDERYAEIAEYKIFTPKQISKLKDKNLDKAKQALELCQRTNVKIITPDSPEYPRILLRTPLCPLVLYVKGELPDLSKYISIANVGTRKMTEIGKRCAYEFAYDLAKSGIVVTSGMALGIDSVAHRAALDAGGRTIAVLGSGIDVIYPSQNTDLYHEICEYGAIVSEFEPGTPPLPYNFPVRNRIVSGLSVGTLVIEAGERSGSLNTARHAQEQGRDLFSVPGPNGEYNNRGTNSLLKTGAHPVTEASDIIDFYTQRYGDQIKFAHITKRRALQSVSLPETKPVSKKRTKAPTVAEASPTCDVQKSPHQKEDYCSLGEPMRSIANALLEKDMFPEEIADAIGVPFNQVLSAVSIMELQGIIKIISGGKFTLV